MPRPSRYEIPAGIVRRDRSLAFAVLPVLMETAVGFSGWRAEPGADLALTQNASPDPVQVGSEVTYTIKIINDGPAAAASVTVTDTLPALTSFVSCAATGGGVCGGSGRRRTVSFGSLAVGASEGVTLVSRVSSTAADRTVLRNTARVRASSPLDPDPGDNGAAAPVTVVRPSAGLALANSASPEIVPVGTDITYTLRISNLGPAAAQSVTLVDTLPAATTFVSCTATGGGVCGGTGNARTVSLAGLAAGASSTITLVARIGSGVPKGAQIGNRAWVQASSPADPDQSDNSATALAATSAGVVYYVSPTGSDAAPGTAEQPFRTVLKAAAVARAGDVVLVSAGTYEGVVQIESSGAPGRPITLRARGDGPVVLRASHFPRPCSNVSPVVERTIRIVRGSDHWRIEGIEIEGGVYIAGTNLDALAQHVRDRGLPGRGMYDPAAARSTIESLGGNAADSIQILNSRIRGRGIYATAARDGRLEGNEVYDIECGTGSAVFLNRFSDGWTIRRNHIHDVAASDVHWMSEGIRLVGASMYNTLAENVLERVNGPGRGIGLDVNSGWNLVRRNRVSETEQAYSEQFGGWGNQWIENVSENNRKFGFRTAAIDPALNTPNDLVPRFMTMRCNRSYGDVLAMSIGWAVESQFEKNDVPTVDLGTNLWSYWPNSGNTWEGGTARPPKKPLAPDLSGCS